MAGLTPSQFRQGIEGGLGRKGRTGAAENLTIMGAFQGGRNDWNGILTCVLNLHKLASCLLVWIIPGGASLVLCCIRCLKSLQRLPAK